MAKRKRNVGTPRDKGLEDSQPPTEGRLARLENRVADLEQRVDRLAGVLPADYDWILSYYGLTDLDRKRSGPKKKIVDAELIPRRDFLVSWLEDIWPEIVHMILAAKSSSDVSAILAPLPESGDALRRAAQARFLEHIDSLLQFIRSDKFRKRPPKKTVIDALNRPSNDERRMRAANRLPPRRIANAMAGVPELSWSRSYERCSGKPSRFVVGDNTARYYREMFGIPVPETGTLGA